MSNSSSRHCCNLTPFELVTAAQYKFIIVVIIRNIIMVVAVVVNDGGVYVGATTTVS